MHFAVIGIGAGAAAALLFASVTSGVWLSIPLFYLAPLPIVIAGLGWSHWAAVTAAVAGALGLGVVFGTVFLFAFAVGAGFPAWWLGYLAMLARPIAAGNGGSQNPASIEWYPPGRLVIWAATLGALVVIVAIPNFGIDADSFRSGLRDALRTILRVKDVPAANAPANVDPLIEILVNAIPPAAASPRVAASRPAAVSPAAARSHRSSHPRRRPSDCPSDPSGHRATSCRRVRAPSALEPTSTCSSSPSGP